MRFLIITNAPTLKEHKGYVAYEPYVREINVWSNYVGNLIILSPTKYNNVLLTCPFNKQPTVIPVKSLNFNSFNTIVSSLFFIPGIVYKIFKACQNADHIHLRCPGNIGLIGCVVQICFPKKIKTAKYAGNWDPKAKQPLSYKLQKWLLSNTFLTKNMTVLVYGDWQKQSKNIKPFFTATYSNSEIGTIIERNYSGALRFVFVGTLSEGKRPLMAIQIVETLQKEGKSVFLDIYGDGHLKVSLQNYITENNLENIVSLHGNQSKGLIKEALKKAHFLILPSKSEGWPKAIAEAMFFGTIPIATRISCVPFMLDYGKRGILIAPELDKAMAVINQALKDTALLESMSEKAANWSQNYTLEVFETEISKLMHHP